MNENNHAHKAGLPPAQPYALPKIEVHVPEVQRQQLMNAIITLVSVLLGIALTLSAQVVSQVLVVEEPGLTDPVAPLGTTHFTAIEADSITVDGETLDATTSGITITGVLTDVILLYKQN